MGGHVFQLQEVIGTNFDLCIRRVRVTVLIDVVAGQGHSDVLPVWPLILDFQRKICERAYHVLNNVLLHQTILDGILDILVRTDNHGEQEGVDEQDEDNHGKGEHVEHFKEAHVPFAERELTNDHLELVPSSRLD